MKTKIRNFVLMIFVIPQLLLAQELVDTKEQTEEEINNFRENYYCVVSHERGKFKGLENCAEGMPVWFITGYGGMENGELAVKFCDFSKTIATPRMNPNYNLVCVFQKNRNENTQ